MPLAPYGNLALLVACSLLLHTAGVTLAQRLYRREAQSALWQVLLEVGRLLFFIGIPAAALFWLRDIPLPSAMGLTNVDWFSGVGLGILLTFGGGGLLLGGWWYYIRSLSSLTSPADYRPPAVEAPPQKALLFVEAGCLELHWAFYRSLPALVLDERYLGVLLGLALVCLEWYLNPAWRRAWRSVEGAEEVAPQTALAVLMAVIYLLIHNLWLCVLIHWLISLAFDRLRFSFPGLRR